MYLWYTVFLKIALLNLISRNLLSATLNDNNENHRSVVIFQAVDISFFPLWVNWWVLAHKFNAIPIGWTLHLACFGGDQLDKQVRQYHIPGCTQIIPSSLYLKRIYFAKWTAITHCFHLGQDVLVTDLDAVMIRNPIADLRLLDDRHSYDIVASRDHGPGDLPFAASWGTSRICTGFIYLKYSKHMVELVDLALSRCDKYGHDQIQFNKGTRPLVQSQHFIYNILSYERPRAYFY